MAYPLNTAIWNLGLAVGLTAGAAGCTERTLTGEGETGSESGEEASSSSSPSSSSSSTTGPECETNSDCAAGYFCTSEGVCEYENYCGLALPPQHQIVLNDNGKPRCSPPLDCYSDDQCGSDEYCAQYYCVPGEVIPECDGLEQAMRPIPMPADGLSLAGDNIFAIDLDDDGVDELLITQQSAPSPAQVWDFNDAVVSLPPLAGTTLDIVRLADSPAGTPRLARLTYAGSPEQVEILDASTWAVEQSFYVPGARDLALADMYPDDGHELFATGTAGTTAHASSANPTMQLQAFSAGADFLSIKAQGNGAKDLWFRDLDETNEVSQYTVLRPGLDAPVQLEAPMENDFGSSVAALEDGGGQFLVRGSEGVPENYSGDFGRIRIDRGQVDYDAAQVVTVASYAVKSNAEPGVVNSSSVLADSGDELVFVGSETIDVVNLGLACKRAFVNPFDATEPLYFGDFDGDGYEDVVGMSEGGPAAYSFVLP